MKFLLSTFLILMLFGCYSIEAEKTGLEGKPMPSFKILLGDSTQYFDTKNLEIGKPVVLFYYGPYCPYSRVQMEEMIDNMGIMKKYQFLVVTRSPLSAMQKFYAHYHLEKYHNITSGIDYTGFLGEYFKITGVPFTAIYDKDKKLLSAYEGKIFVKQIISTVNP